MERLASAILIQMLKDWKQGKNRAEIEDFLKSEWFSDLADAAGFEPKVVRSSVLSGKYDCASLRAAYR